MTAKKTTTKNTGRTKPSKIRTASPKSSKRQKRGATGGKKSQQRPRSNSRSQQSSRRPRELESELASPLSVQGASQEQSTGSRCTEVQTVRPQPPLVQIAARTSLAIRHQCRDDGTSSFSPGGAGFKTWRARTSVVSGSSSVSAIPPVFSSH